MSININIRQTGTERKPLPLKIILGADFLYGIYDEGWRLHSGERSDDMLVAYMPMQIARGIIIEWHEQETEEVRLKVSIPTAQMELKAMHEMVYRIATFWECEIKLDGMVVSLEDFLDGYDTLVEFNQNSLQHVAKSILSGENSEMSLFSAMWPLVIGRDEAEAFIAEPSYFSKWLHDKQKVDAYYVKPSFFRGENGIFGRYMISEEMRCILPMKPYVPFGFDDPETNELIQCDEYGMHIYIVQDEMLLGEVPYDDFLEKIKKMGYSKVKKYDGKHLIVEPLSVEELKELIE